MREYTMPVMVGLVVIVSVIWCFIMSVEVMHCENYESLTGIKTAMLKGKCYQYVDGQLQIVKEKTDEVLHDVCSRC